MKINQIAIVILCGVLLLPTAWAEEKKWQGEAELGIVVTDGNTETRNINGKAGIEHEVEKFRNTAQFETSSAADVDGTSAERYLLSGKSSYKYNQFDYAFVTAQYDDDRFSGFDYQASIAAGYGRRLIASDKTKLDVEIGPGYRETKTGLGDTEGDAILRLAAEFAHKISDTSKFKQSLVSEVGEDNTISKSVSSLTAQVAGSLATKISLTIKNTSDTPPGVEDTDTETAVTLVYSF